MSLLITTAGRLKKSTTAVGWELFRKDSMFHGNGDPNEWPESEEVAVDKLELLKYGATRDYKAIRADVAEMTGKSST